MTSVLMEVFAEKKGCLASLFEMIQVAVEQRKKGPCPKLKERRLTGRTGEIRKDGLLNKTTRDENV